ncbi:hypothetical protein DYB35_013674 [Aphanomyces astaci]|uniref:HAT C-terminal dimerisation domain-containing protein n=1 Tax=Aphanomyces astaci TaxID=112090 RepID=A0A3R7END2_APHAT|nr:hypothetical protein DYB35_013674 [Aphanomyces astaci]RHZ07626.1 hypothetical protein DYB26_015469 [Aphanomyces astaci]
MSRLTPICVKTLKSAMDKVTRNVEAKIAAELPDVFGLCIDGRTDGSKHFYTIFATYAVANVRHTPLLAMSPLLKSDSMDADAHIAFIEETLGLYGIELANLAFVTGDNCSTNVSMAAKMGVPLVECYSHNFNLAMKALLVLYETDLLSIHAIMTRLGRLRPAGEVTRFTDLLPVCRNVTRWSSTFQMVQRYLALLRFLPEVSGVRDLLLLSEQNTRVKKLLFVLEQFESVTRQLQAEDLDMADARTMFHGLHCRHPTLPYLAFNAEILHYPNFDNGVAKVLSLREDELTTAEKAALVMFLLDPDSVAVPSTPLSYADELLLQNVAEWDQQQASTAA